MVVGLTRLLEILVYFIHPYAPLSFSPSEGVRREVIVDLKMVMIFGTPTQVF